MLTEQNIQKFQELYKKRFNQEISKEKAYAKGIKLVRLMQLIYKPMTDQEYEHFSKPMDEEKGMLVDKNN